MNQVFAAIRHVDSVDFDAFTKESHATNINHDANNVDVHAFTIERHAIHINHHANNADFHALTSESQVINVNHPVNNINHNTFTSQRHSVCNENVPLTGERASFSVVCNIVTGESVVNNVVCVVDGVEFQNFSVGIYLFIVKKADTYRRRAHVQK